MYKRQIVWNMFGKPKLTTAFNNESYVAGEVITQEELKSVIRYDETTGQLIWKFRNKKTFANAVSMKKFHLHFAGKVAQTKVDKDGRPCLSLANKIYRVKNLVWLYHHGEFPQGRLQEIDGDKTNTRIENLQPLRLSNRTTTSNN